MCLNIITSYPIEKHIKKARKHMFVLKELEEGRRPGFLFSPYRRFKYEPYELYYMDPKGPQFGIRKVFFNFYQVHQGFHYQVHQGFHNYFSPNWRFFYGFSTLYLSIIPKDSLYILNKEHNEIVSNRIIVTDILLHKDNLTRSFNAAVKKFKKEREIINLKPLIK